MRILVTNDDGIDSTGLHELARALVPLGDVVVAAPDREYSGFSAALGTLHTMQPEVQREHLEGIPEAWSITAAPAMCVFFARLGVFGDIDLVVSGINPGVNVGRSVYHSGTVGAALTARNGGISGIAVSQHVTGSGVEGQGWDEMLIGLKWESAASVAAEVTRGLIADMPADPVVINVNVPNLDLHEMAGWRLTEIGTVPPRTIGSARLVPREGYESRYHVEMDWGDERDLPSDTDGGTVEEGVVSVSYIGPLAHEDRDDLDQVAKALTAHLG